MGKSKAKKLNRQSNSHETKGKSNAEFAKELTGFKSDVSKEK